MKKFHEYFMTPISILGTGCLERIVDYIKPMMFRKALIVSDKILVDSGLIDKLLNLLDAEGIFYIIYKDVSPNPTVTQVNYGLKLLNDNGCDFLISFGGGSPHDCAKAIALLATNQGEIAHYEGLNKSKKQAAPLIAINTTAGTGSELTRFCVITDEERHVKMAVNDWHVTPIIAVSDAELMIGMPPGLTAATGMDALTHAIEAYVSTNASPVTDCKAVKAVELIVGNLRTAYQNGSDVKAREAMVYAEYLAGIAFNNANLGYVHALAHQLGGFYNLPHGLCNAVLLPAVMEYNLPAAVTKYADLARSAGIDTAGLSAEASARQFIAQVQQLNKDLGLPARLSELRGFKPEDIPGLAENALKDVCCLTNPRQGSQQDLETIYRAIL
ncbi:iron-containing alcohol dehydrogenase [Sporomusa acidovorans]|uniref:Alcohol dehydrogenase 2 n=1 Tax=Sporomusa acidovorans (strain ATCC 49682 / DSM 3132 / Mol) TaxID=1123286 RepID=A0ABZ3IYX3_SPOA4|nr:iron-containing alcohol dehydrogenase [Sporomusa acidovorans]OZC14155.1 alcohol dehydrogenase 2 [Sporomusa acidovorans DSM 3132]SDE69874.1 alcohol dehydrogenase [Sporomusa acidovorans]